MADSTLDDCPPATVAATVAEDTRRTVAALNERSSVEASEKEDTLRTAGQRGVNLIWERTHASIAIMCTAVTLSVCAYLVVSGHGHEGAFQLLGNVFFIIVGTTHEGLDRR